MTIKQHGGIFGRNPTFNDVTVEGNLSVTGGTIDGTVIGGTNPAAISGTTGTFSGNLVVDTNTMYVDSTNNRVGIGTSSPNKQVTISSPTNDVEILRINVLGAAGNVQGKGDIGFGFYDGVTEASAAIGFEEFNLGSTGGNLLFKTRPTGAAISTRPTERLRIEDSGNVKVSTGNLIIGTAGKGIDFSATAGTGTSELFSDYEEGAWTPTFSAEFTTAPTVTSAQYTKIGRQVTVTMLATDGVVTAGGSIGGLPFASNASQGAGAYGGNSDTTESLQGTVGQSASSITNIPARTLTGDTWQITATYFT